MTPVVEWLRTASYAELAACLYAGIAVLVTLTALHFLRPCTLANCVRYVAYCVLLGSFALGCAEGNAGEVCTQPNAADCESHTGGEAGP